MGLGGEKAAYALAEFYLSLIAYYVLHMIFVISSDFVEAFNIPPLNIGIYVDKMAAIRALLMVIADLLEWAITQKWLGDPGQKNFKQGQSSLTKLMGASDFGDKWYRRLGSLLSYFAMLVCRIVYLYLIYFSDNKSLTVFVTLCIEGFWFGVFQMSFFAVGPEFNAFTSFGIHTMGNFIFFTQVILNNLSKKYPSINSLFRVRAHGWIVLVTSLIALPIWIVFCYYYSYGGGDSEEFRELADELRGVSVTNSDQVNKISENLAEAFKSGTKFKALITQLNTTGSINRKENLTTIQLQTAISQQATVKNAIAELVTAMYGAEVSGSIGSKDISAQEVSSGMENKLKVELKDSRSSGIKPGEGEVQLEFQSNSAGKGVKVEIKIDNTKPGSLVKQSDNGKNNNVAATEIARRIAKAARKAANNDISYNPGNELLKSKMEFGIESANVEKDSDNQQKVKVTSAGGNESSHTIKVRITGGGDKFNSLVNEIVSETEFTGGNTNAVATALAQTIRDAGSPKYADLVKKLKTQLTKQSVKKLSDLNADRLESAINGGDVKQKIADLVTAEFKGVTDVDSASNVNVAHQDNTVTVTLGDTSSPQDQGKAEVKGTSVEIQIKANPSTKIDTNNGPKIAKRLAKAARDAANQVENANLVEDLVKDFGITASVKVEGDGTNVEVKIGDGSGISKSATIKVEKGPSDSQNIQIQVKGNSSTPTEQNGQAIANSLALALLDKRVVKAAKEKNKDVTISLDSGKQPEVEINVSNARSKAQANRIAFKLGSALEKVQSVVIGTTSPSILKLSLSKDNWMIAGHTNHVWSPLLLFIIGAFAEDFAVPGILPFAFLDPDKASLVNYLTPSFFMTGSMIIVFLNDIFEVKGFAKDLGMSRFKEWSEGAADGWHSLWLLNLLKYTAFFIAMFSVHGTFDNLRCIIQSRWRVMLLTMFIVVPRATLEVAGYVGVANYAILAGETNDFSGFDYIAYHDVLAMFCRFVYGKFAVGYNQTLE